MKGKGKLKVVGILFIIFGALGIITSLLGLAGGGLFLAFDSSGMGSVLGSTLTAVMVVMLAWSVYELIVGILGVKHCDKKEKAGVLLALGIILTAVALVSGVITMVFTSFAVQNVISCLAGLVLPVIYTWGARQNQE